MFSSPIPPIVHLLHLILNSKRRFSNPRVEHLDILMHEIRHATFSNSICLYRANNLRGQRLRSVKMCIKLACYTQNGIFGFIPLESPSHDDPGNSQEIEDKS